MSEYQDGVNERAPKRDGVRAVKILLPRANTRDVLSAETFIGALGLTEPLALELAATARETIFLVRGEGHVVEHALSQLRLAYRQCDFEELEQADDPAWSEWPAWEVRELRLREPAYLPIRTHISREGRISNDDLERASDPMIGVLSAMEGLADDEVCVVQYSIQAMPPAWSKYWRGSVGDISERTKATPQGMAAQVMLPLGVALVSMGVLFLLATILIKAGALLWGLALAWLIAGIGLIVARARISSPPDPLLVKQKINQSAFRVQARIFVGAQDRNSASQRLQRLVGALRGYDLAGGNGFEFVPPAHWASPRDFRFLHKTNEPYVGFLRRTQDQLPILSTSELTALWHLPHGEVGLQGVRYVVSRRLTPLSSQVAHGVHIGYSRLQGHVTEVRLSREALSGNIGLVAKTQSGKSNLMALLARDIIVNDPDAAVIVIDPHRSLAQQLARLIPPEREPKTIYWSVADRDRPFGLNLLDRIPKSSFATPLSASDLFADKRIGDIIDAFQEIWSDNWGPRMEDYLRGPLLTLARANEILSRNYTFDHWLSEANLRLEGNVGQINSGRIDAQTLTMIEEISEGYRELPAPNRPAFSVLHGALAAYIDDYGRNKESWEAGMPGASRKLIKAIRELQQALRAGVDEKPDEQGAALWARTYEGERRPFQFTILDVNAALMGSTIRHAALSGLDPIADQYIVNWWRESYDAYLSLNARLLLDMITPVTKKLNRFAASEVARRIFGQPDSTIDLPDIIHQGQILLVDLAAGVIGSETAALIGSTLLNWLASTLFALQEIQGKDRKRRVFIVVDEFQSLPGANYTMILSELAKYGAQLVLGTQSLHYLMEVSAKTHASWLANTSALFVFRSGADDARQLAAELSIADEDRLTVTPADIVGLSDYSCFVRVQDDRRTPHVFRVDTRRVDEGNDMTFSRIRAQSREKYGRDASEVDKWVYRASKWQGKTSLVSESHSVHLQPVLPLSTANTIQAPTGDKRQLAEIIRAEQRADKRDDPPLQ